MTTMAMSVNHGIESAISSVNFKPAKIDTSTNFDKSPYYGLSSFTHRYGTPYWPSNNKTSRGRRSIGLSILTLLSFLYFLHILQSCIQEFNTVPRPSQTILVQAKAESNERVSEKERSPSIAKTNDLLDLPTKCDRNKISCT
ncbi:uncharacterized protein [Euwallacea similis]|uniref:uncharacterized protein n=1 Tax=Euwallacea similis TaxID=1736056 RepID=UPI00344F2E3E